MNAPLNRTRDTPAGQPAPPERQRVTGRRTGRTAGKRHPWKAAFFGVAALALAGGVAWALLGSSILVVRSIRVTGAPLINRARVLAAADVALGTPLIRINTGAVARRVERITQVQSASVTRSWPDAIVISITARKAVFAFPAQGGFERVDAYGVVLGWSSRRPNGLVPLTVAASQASQGVAGGLGGDRAAVATAGQVVRELPAWLRRQVVLVTAAGPSAVTLTLRGGATVVWGGAGQAALKASELAVLLRTGKRYYDVSDPVTAVSGTRPVSRSPAASGPSHGALHG